MTTSIRYSAKLATGTHPGYGPEIRLGNVFQPYEGAHYATFPESAVCTDLSQEYLRNDAKKRTSKVQVDLFSAMGVS